MSGMQVSAKHVHLFRDEQDFWIKDCGSVKGTWLNGSRLSANQKQRITPGDEIQVGTKDSSKFTFRIKRVHSSVWEQVQQSSTDDMDAPKSVEAVSA